MGTQTYGTWLIVHKFVNSTPYFSSQGRSNHPYSVFVIGLLLNSPVLQRSRDLHGEYSPHLSLCSSPPNSTPRLLGVLDALVFLRS